MVFLYCAHRTLFCLLFPLVCMGRVDRNARLRHREGQTLPACGTLRLLDLFRESPGQFHELSDECPVEGTDTGSFLCLIEQDNSFPFNLSVSYSHH